MFLFHHLDKWAFANLDLIEETEETEKKAVVLISGASSSGKSHGAKYLSDFLAQNHHRAVTISLDQYNFGLSGIIPNKVNVNFFHGRLPHLQEIEARIKKIIYDVPFDKKYAEPVIEKIRPAIQDLLPKKDQSRFLAGLVSEWKKLNFDESSVYNLREAAEDIRSLLAGKTIDVKAYSKVISERIPCREKVDGKDYDVIIVEGIYALDPTFLRELKGVPTVKDFIDGNAKSLFLRRIIRDQKLTSADNVFTISLYFKYIVKAYTGTILPCRANADVVLNNDMTFAELRAGDLYTTKDEIHTDSAKLIDFLKRYGKTEGVAYQKDTYFVVPGESQASLNILRLREISHDKGRTYVVSSLVHKGSPKVRKDNKIIRPINVLLREGQTQKVWKDASDCIADFVKAGFQIGSVEKKVKTRLVYEGQALTIREVEDQGAYLEFSNPLDSKVIAEIRKKVLRYQREEQDE
jgi:uridine kinase/adenylate cyclase class IV